MKEEAQLSFQQGRSVGDLKVLELVLEDHQQEIPLSPAVDKAFQYLMAALRGSPQRPRKPSRENQKKKGLGSRSSRYCDCSTWPSTASRLARGRPRDGLSSLRRPPSRPQAERRAGEVGGSSTLLTLTQYIIALAP